MISSGTGLLCDTSAIQLHPLSFQEGPEQLPSRRGDSENARASCQPPVHPAAGTRVYSLSSILECYGR